jgi:hypothetical protein
VFVSGLMRSAVDGVSEPETRIGADRGGRGAAGGWGEGPGRGERGSEQVFRGQLRGWKGVFGVVFWGVF